MMEKLNLDDFDILGIINLSDVQGIEKYTTPIIENGKIKGYLSRSKEYYNVKNMTELAHEREELKNILSRDLTKKNFVILENMLNCSGKVYFKKFENYIKNKKSDYSLGELKQAENCLLEDVRNILVILSKKGLIKISKENVLPTGNENSNKRAIEMDNKALLYLFLKSMNLKKDPQNLEILTIGYGSTYVGPFFKSMYGCNFTNTLKSKYIDETVPDVESHGLSSLVSSTRIFENGKKILLIDDNVGTGATIKEMKDALEKENIHCIGVGAIQYNWRNYYRVSTGEKKDIDRFNINDFDFLTPLNYAGHKLYKNAIDLLHSSGLEYIKYLKSKSYRLNGYSDLQGILDRGIFCARKSGIELADGYDVPIRSLGNNEEILEKYRNEPSEVTNKIAINIIRNIIENVNHSISLQENDVQK